MHVYPSFHLSFFSSLSLLQNYTQLHEIMVMEKVDVFLSVFEYPSEAFLPGYRIGNISDSSLISHFSAWFQHPYCNGYQ
jgi:hypothetical protein